MASNSIAFFCGTLQHNLRHREGQQRRRFERQVYSYFVPEDQREKLEDELHKVTLGFRSDLTHLIEGYESRDVEDKTEAIGVGLFFFRHPMDKKIRD